ncbi:MAG: small-conductance mechanosensitive channel [Rhodoferax sp.]
MIDRVIDLLHLFAVEEFSRLTITLVALIITPLSLSIIRKMLARTEGTLAVRRERQVIWRNVVMITAAVTLIAIWGSKIAGFALSLAAVAGAILIVSKEALLNLIGFVNITVTRPFGFGDYIEIGNASGRVVDINAMYTTVLETRQGHQVTGQTVTIPNSMLLTQTVRNFTVTGEFVIYLLTIKIDRTWNITNHESALASAAAQVCATWQKQANVHLKSLELAQHVDLPSAETRVIITLDDSKSSDLTVRYTCRPNDRVKVEQQILRRYIESVSHTRETIPVRDDE